MSIHQRSYKPHPNNTTKNIINNLPGNFPEKVKVYIEYGTNKKTWKASLDNSSNIFLQTVAQNSRNQNNYTVDPFYERLPRHSNKGSLNPIKHWRKQLIAVNDSGSSKASVSQSIDYPGGSVSFNKNILLDCSSCIPALTTYLTEYQDNCSCDSPINNSQKITRPRSSQTIIKKNYYTTTGAYLKNRVKTYIQNQTLNPSQPTTSYVKTILQPKSANNYVYPMNSNIEGSQLYKSTSCINDNCCNTTDCFVSVIYKPNNPFYSVQGAVDSSTKIMNIKYQAITKNNFDFAQLNQNNTKTNLAVNGEELPGSTPIMYRGNTSAPYFIKSKYQDPSKCIYSINNRMTSGGSGIKSVCKNENKCTTSGK